MRKTIKERRRSNQKQALTLRRRLLDEAQRSGKGEPEDRPNEVSVGATEQTNRSREIQAQKQEHRGREEAGVDVALVEEDGESQEEDLHMSHKSP